MGGASPQRARPLIFPTPPSSGPLRHPLQNYTVCTAGSPRLAIPHQASRYPRQVPKVQGSLFGSSPVVDWNVNVRDEPRCQLVEVGMQDASTETWAVNIDSAFHPFLHRCTGAAWPPFADLSRLPLRAAVPQRDTLLLKPFRSSDQHHCHDLAATMRSQALPKGRKVPRDGAWPGIWVEGSMGRGFSLLAFEI
jgi:hypothetical protein